MRRGSPSTAVRQYNVVAAAACAGILTLGLVTAPQVTHFSVPLTEVHAVQLMAVTAADVAAVAAPASTRPVAARQPAADDTTAAATPDFLAFAASILEYLNSLGLGAGPGIVAIGLTGFATALAVTAYVWNSGANLVNPWLRTLGIPRVPKFPVCFAGQVCANRTAGAQAVRVAPAAKPASGLVTPTGRGVASSGRVAPNDKNNSAAKARGSKKPASSAKAAAGKGRSAR